MGEHRVRLLGSSWRRSEDPAASRDPRVRAVVGALATLPAPEMRAEFRAELRAQLVAITPRVVTEAAETGPMTDSVPASAPRPRPTPQGRGKAVGATPARHSDSFVDRLRGIRLGRPLAVAAAVLAAFGLLLGGAVVMSKKALPGDALYGLKRASERLELATAGSDTEKAKDYLKFASRRAEEVSDLLGRATGSARDGVHAAGLDADTAELIGSTLGSADTDVTAAARLLNTSAVQHSSAAPLATMTNWTPGQTDRLREIAARVSDPALHARAVSSLRLVQAAQARAEALRASLGCGCLGSSGSDELGPKPCTPCTSTQGQQPSQPKSHQPRPTAKPKTHRPTGATATTGPGSSSSTARGAGSTSPTTPSGSETTSPPLVNLPSLLPSVTPSLPVDVNTCGASISLPLLGGVDLTLCDGSHATTGG